MSSLEIIVRLESWFVCNI